MRGYRRHLARSGCSRLGCLNVASIFTAALKKKSPSYLDRRRAGRHWLTGRVRGAHGPAECHDSLIGSSQGNAKRYRIRFQGAEISEQGIVVVPEAKGFADPPQLDAESVPNEEADLGSFKVGSVQLANLGADELVYLPLAVSASSRPMPSSASAIVRKPSSRYRSEVSGWYSMMKSALLPRRPRG